jgi:glutathione S-transferase
VAGLGRRATEKVAAALSQIESEVSTFSEQPDDIGLIAIGCALGYLDFRFAELNWRAGHPLTAAWFALFAAHPAMTATHPHV